MKSMRPTEYALVALLLLLQYPLWLSSSGVVALWQLDRKVTAQEEENARLKERNLALTAEVVDLKGGLRAIEERARMELGMVKRGETFYQVIEHLDEMRVR